MRAAANRLLLPHRSNQDDLELRSRLAPLVSTMDGGCIWRDRVTGGPKDTHELAVHRNAPDSLRVSAGDRYFESDDAGATWRSPSMQPKLQVFSNRQLFAAAGKQIGVVSGCKRH